MTTALDIRPQAGLRRTRHGYVAVGPTTIACRTPIVDARIDVTSDWTTDCFAPAFTRAWAIWGSNAKAIATEILSALVPSIRLRAPETGAERELQRRIELAVAVLLNSRGIPTRYPPDPRTPRPRVLPAGAPWYRALMTGWAR